MVAITQTMKVDKEGNYTVDLFANCRYCGVSMPFNWNMLEAGVGSDGISDAIVLHKACRFPYWKHMAELQDERERKRAEADAYRKAHPILAWLKSLIDLNYRA